MSDKFVYVISEGSYSDYRIIRVFATRELAVEFVGGNPSESYYNIEELPFHEEVPERSLLWKCCAFIGERGRGYPPDAYIHAEIHMPPIKSPRIEARTRENYPYPGERYFDAWGTDRHAVIKSVADRYYQAVALAEPPPPDPDWKPSVGPSWVAR